MFNFLSLNSILIKITFKNFLNLLFLNFFILLNLLLFKFLLNLQNFFLFKFFKISQNSTKFITLFILLITNFFGNHYQKFQNSPKFYLIKLVKICEMKFLSHFHLFYYLNQYLSLINHYYFLIIHKKHLKFLLHLNSNF